MNIQETEERLGFKLGEFAKRAIPASRMVANAKPEIKGLGEEQVERAKEKVFNNTVQFIEAEGYPTEFDFFFDEAKISDLVAIILLPIVIAFRRETGRKLHLQRELDTISTNFIGIKGHKFVFVAEAAKSSIGQAKRGCMLTLKEMGDNNPGGVIYGLVTSGDVWQIIRYQREIFTQTNSIQVAFRTMEHDKAKWLKESSIIVDFLDTALRSEGFVAA